MALETLKTSFGSGGTGIPDLGKHLKELQGLRVNVVAGAAAGTKMNVAALREEDTLVAVIASNAGVLSDDTANVTVQATKASATITHSVANPADGGTVSVNGVTYTYKTSPTLLTHVKIGTTFAITGDNLATTINTYERRYQGSSYGMAVPAVVAVSNGSGVVTVTSVADGAGNGPVVTSSDGTDLAVSNTDPAAVTVTAAAVDADDTVTVNGVTFTAKATPTLETEFLLNNGDNTAQALNLANAVNAYENKYGTLDVVATPAAAVVTFAPKSARKGNIIQLAENATNVAVSGAFLANGTNTGGIKSTTNLASQSVLVVWFNKR